RAVAPVSLWPANVPVIGTWRDCVIVRAGPSTRTLTWTGAAAVAVAAAPRPRMAHTATAAARWWRRVLANVSSFLERRRRFGERQVFWLGRGFPGVPGRPADLPGLSASGHHMVRRMDALTAAGPRRIRTGFPLPLAGAPPYHRCGSVRGRVRRGRRSGTGLGRGRGPRGGGRAAAGRGRR